MNNLEDVLDTIISEMYLKDKERQELASMMIKNLSEMKGGLQFLIVTHNSALMESADKCFRVVKENDISHVTEINS